MSRLLDGLQQTSRRTPEERRHAIAKPRETEREALIRLPIDRGEETAVLRQEPAGICQQEPAAHRGAGHQGRAMTNPQVGEDTTDKQAERRPAQIAEEEHQAQQQRHGPRRRLSLEPEKQEHREAEQHHRVVDTPQRPAHGWSDDRAQESTQRQKGGPGWREIGSADDVQQDDNGRSRHRRQELLDQPLAVADIEPHDVQGSDGGDRENRNAQGVAEVQVPSQLADRMSPPAVRLPEIVGVPVKLHAAALDDGLGHQQRPVRVPSGVGHRRERHQKERECGGPGGHQEHPRLHTPHNGKIG